MNTTSNGEPSAAAITAAMAAYGLFIGVIFLVTLALVIVIQWRIAAKAGYNGALSLLLLVPMVNFIVLLIFAFGEWPIEAQLRAVRSGPGGGPPMTI
jgi:uncharacterized membrane protein YhaH (DUF805 family)